MRLVTPRLIVRDWDPPADAEDAFAIFGDPEVHTYLIGSKPVPTVESQREMLTLTRKRMAELNNGTGFFAVEHAGTGRVVGASLLKWLPGNDGKPTTDMEIGWYLARDQRGHGYATESAAAVATHAFATLPIPELLAVVFAENRPSLAVARRVGLSHRGTSEKYYGVKAELFGTTRAEWSARVASGTGLTAPK